MIQITPRERLLALGLAVAVGAWSLYGLALRPAAQRICTLQRVIPEQQTQLHDLQAKSTQYTELRQELEQARSKLAAQEPDFQIMPFLESMIDRHHLTQHVSTMSPAATAQSQADYGQTVVTMDLHDLSLKELIDFLSAVETTNALVRVASLHIHKDPKNEARLDSTVGIACPKPGQPALATQTAR
jgi:type II secretory pathway component PulM